MSLTGKITAKAVARHRNGVSGDPFTVILFDEKSEGVVSHKMAVLFDKYGKCAVFDTDLLAQSNIRFGENSWRGDTYESEMRKIAKKWEESL